MHEIEISIIVMDKGKARFHSVFRQSGSDRLRYASGDGSGSLTVREIVSKEIRCIVCALISGVPDHVGQGASPRIEMKVSKADVGKQCNVVSAGDDRFHLSLRDTDTGISESMKVRFGELKCLLYLLFNEERFPGSVREAIGSCGELCRVGCSGLPFVPKNHKAHS